MERNRCVGIATSSELWYAMKVCECALAMDAFSIYDG